METEGTGVLAGLEVVGVGDIAASQSGGGFPAARAVGPGCAGDGAIASAISGAQREERAGIFQQDAQVADGLFIVERGQVFGHIARAAGNAGDGFIHPGTGWALRSGRHFDSDRPVRRGGGFEGPEVRTAQVALARIEAPVAVGDQVIDEVAGPVEQAQLQMDAAPGERLPGVVQRQVQVVLFHAQRVAHADLMIGGQPVAIAHFDKEAAGPEVFFLHAEHMEHAPPAQANGVFDLAFGHELAVVDTSGVDPVAARSLHPHRVVEDRKPVGEQVQLVLVVHLAGKGAEETALVVAAPVAVRAIQDQAAQAGSPFQQGTARGYRLGRYPRDGA